MAPRKVPRYERFTVTHNEDRIARERTDYLLRMVDRPLSDLIANAYLQGICDAAETMANRDPPHDR